MSKLLAIGELPPHMDMTGGKQCRFVRVTCTECCKHAKLAWVTDQWDSFSRLVVAECHGEKRLFDITIQDLRHSAYTTSNERLDLLWDTMRHRATDEVQLLVDHYEKEGVANLKRAAHLRTLLFGGPLPEDP